MSPAPQPQTLTARNVRNYVLAHLDLGPGASGAYLKWLHRLGQARQALDEEPTKQNVAALREVQAAEPRTAASLARALGMSTFSLNRRLNQGLPFTFDEVVRLADYFHTSTEELGGHGATNQRRVTPRPASN